MNDEIILLTPADVAQMLGTSIRTVERLVQAGRLPAPLKVGRASRWRRDAILAALAQRPADDAPADKPPDPTQRGCSGAAMS